MISLDDQISFYSNSSFDAEATARHFFAEHSENEVHQKLNELANLQNQIENNLRHKVRDNYGLFMFANDEINRVGEEMSDLKHLLNSTKKMLEELQSMRPAGVEGADFKAKASAPATPSRCVPPSSATGTDKDSTEHASGKSKSKGKGGIPSWVVSTPQEVARLIVEQQFSKAVALTVRSLAYLDSVSEVGGNELAIAGIAEAIQKNRLILAQTLRDSLTKLSSSDLFGAAEQTKRLKLLINLGHSALAAQGFASGRKDVIRKALRYVEASGDPAAFTAELSRVFFVHLRDACQSFLDLFSRHPTPSVGSAGSALSTSDEAAVASLSYLVGWLQDQMTVFVTALARQIQVGAAEYAAEVFQQSVSALLQRPREEQLLEGGRRPSSTGATSPLKRTSSYLPPGSGGGGRGGGGGGGGDSLGGRLKRVSSVSAVPMNRASLTLGSSTRLLPPSPSGAGPGAVVALGPLTFTSQCLQVAFREAVVLDRLGLQGASSLSWNMMPELKAIVNCFADDIIKDVDRKVAGDLWVPVQCAQCEVLLPRPAQAKQQQQQPAARANAGAPKKNKGLSSLFGGISNEEDDDDVLGVVENSLRGEVSVQTSSSYQWVAALLSYFIAEVYSLLQVQGQVQGQVQEGGSSFSSRGSIRGSGSSGSYSRVDLCELEPEAVACILRILIRYVRAVISLDARALTLAQRQCYCATLEELQASLLPSAEDAVLKGFFSDGSTLVATPPKSVFQSLRTSLEVASATLKEE